MCIFATFSSANNFSYNRVILAISLIIDEFSSNALERFEFLRFVLSVYKKYVSYIALVVDNASTYRSFGRQVISCFVACHNHRFNLAVKEKLQPHDDLLSKVEDVIKRLSFQIPAAKLHQRTHLQDKQSDDTRWSSSYHMLQRYMELEAHLKLIDDDGIREMLLSSDELDDAKDLCKKLNTQGSVKVKLQRRLTTLADPRTLFDTVIAKHPCLKG